MPDSGKRKRVLVVDDEKTIAVTLERIFSLRGYEAVAVFSAEEALALMPVWIPDFALLDVILPGMSGIDLAILMKAEYPTCQLTLISAHLDTFDLLSHAHPEVQSLKLLPKPVHPTVLLDLLGEPIDYSPTNGEDGNPEV